MVYVELTGLQHSSVGGGGGGGGGGPSTPISIANGGTFATSYTTGTVLYYDGTRFVSSPIFRVSANSTEQRNSTNAQSVYWYNTYTSATDNEKVGLSWATNVAQLMTEKGSGGGTARVLSFGTDGTQRWEIGATSGHFLAVTDDTYDIGTTSGSRPRNIIASQVIVGGTFVKFTGNARSRMSAPSDGTLLMEDATGAGTFSSLIWGPNSASGVALKRSTTTLEVKLADDSAYTPIRSSQLIVGDGTVGNPSIVLASDNDGTGTGFYRVAANELGIAVNGVQTVNATASSLQLTTSIYGIVGANNTVTEVIRAGFQSRTSGAIGWALQSGNNSGTNTIFKIVNTSGSNIAGGDTTVWTVPTLGIGNANITSQDLILARDAADTLAQRRTTNAQSFRIYNTFTDASNYERGKFGWASNVLQIGTEAAGTGSARDLVLGTGTTFTERLRVNASGLTIADAHDVVLNTTTGTKIGTATTQKLGFWNVTPIVQPASANQATITDITGGTPGSSLVDVTATPTQTAINNNFATINVLLLAIRTALVDSGIMKGSA